ncbi:MAG: hypothetical protein JOY95_01180 [Silvibacterium sp.]|nr:hypothetical protein [Silvibacterium sp.]
MSSTIVGYLDQDAACALSLLKEDISVVSAAAGSHGVSPLLLQHALQSATEAFFTCGNAHHPAWSALVTAIDDILIFRSQFADGVDAAAYKRLRIFVDENSDALTVEGQPVAS